MRPLRVICAGLVAIAIVATPARAQATTAELRAQASAAFDRSASWAFQTFHHDTLAVMAAFANYAALYPFLRLPTVLADNAGRWLVLIVAQEYLHRQAAKSRGDPK